VKFYINSYITLILYIIFVINERYYIIILMTIQYARARAREINKK